MKVFFDSIHKLKNEFQECFIDENNWDKAVYSKISMEKLNVCGVTYNDIYSIEPLSYYKIKLKNIPSNFIRFEPNIRLLEAGLIVSDIHKKTKNIFIYNCTNNTVFLNSKACMGDLYD